jgi:transposase
MPKFKPYNQNQPMLLPLDLRSCLPSDHVAFMISDIVDDLNLDSINATYSDFGSPAFDSAMMTKILFYAYVCGICSSRKIEAKLYEDNAFRFLAANIHPDHRTINMFRSNHLVFLDEIFAQIVILCDGLNMVNLKIANIDGTKIAANASRDNLYTKERLLNLKSKIREMLEQCQRIDEEEDKEFGSKRGYHGMPEEYIDPEKRKKAIKKMKDRLAKIKEAEQIIDDKQNKVKTNEDKNRSKNNTTNLTDSDANLMKMKDDSFKMAYNIQLSTSSQVIIAYGISQEPTDMDSLPIMIDRTQMTTGQHVDEARADSGFFSKNNIVFCQNNNTDAYIPDAMKALEESQERTNGVPKYDRRNFHYNQERDEFICPLGSRLVRSYAIKGAGKKYIGTDCQRCPHKTECTKGKNRHITYDPALDQIKIEMRAKLNSEGGKAKYLERMSDIEPVFGNLKYNQGFTKFLCRGKPKALIELGLHCIAHNFIKIFNHSKKIKKDKKNIERLNNLMRLQAKYVAA